MSLEIGQTLWFVPYRQGQPCEITVTKLGRKWAKTKGSGWREIEIDINTFREKPHPQGVGVRGTAYLSKSEYDRKIAMNKNWDDFVSRLSRVSAPNGVTFEQVETMRGLCGIAPYREIIK